MTLCITPEKGVPLTDGVKDMPLLERTAALSKTCDILEPHGLSLVPDEVDKEIAATLVTAHATDPVLTAKEVTTKRVDALTPASIVLANSILQEFHHSTVKSAQQLRNLVTNKLIIATDSPDPKIQMRALELLGKFSDVGLFSEKTEVTITHQTTSDLKEQLRTKLTKLMNTQENIEEATIVVEKTPIDEFVDKIPDIAVKPVNIADELGLHDDD